MLLVYVLHDPSHDRRVDERGGQKVRGDFDGVLDARVIDYDAVSRADDPEDLRGEQGCDGGFTVQDPVRAHEHE